jgi:hypothetical protein
MGEKAAFKTVLGMPNRQKVEKWILNKQLS